MSPVSRVLIIEAYSYPGGMWHYACCLTRGLATAGFDVVLAATVPFERMDGFGDLNVRSIGPRVSPTGSGLGFSAQRALTQLNRFQRLSHLVREFHPQIVHANSPTGKFDFLYFRYLRARGARVVYTAHEPDPDTGVDWFDWARYRAADGILVHSLKSRDAITAGGIDGSKITRIHHGTYLDLCQRTMSKEDAKRSLGLGPDARVVLFFGGIAPYKGLDVLIRAFSRLAGAMPDAYLIIAGQPQEDFSKYQDEIAASGVSNRIILDLRYIPFAEFPKYFGAADVVALPYRRIQQSGALQLAYAHSRPVVATDVGDLRERVAEDHTGIVVPPEDPGAFASGIHDALANVMRSEEMGRRGRLLAETKYSWSAVAERISEVYRSLFNGETKQRGAPSPTS